MEWPPWPALCWTMPDQRRPRPRPVLEWSVVTFPCWEACALPGWCLDVYDPEEGRRMHRGTAWCHFPRRLACQQVAGPCRDGLNPHCTEEDAEGPQGLWLPLGPRPRKAWRPPTSGNPPEGPTGSSLGCRASATACPVNQNFTLLQPILARVPLQDRHGVQRPERCIQAGRDVGPQG